MEEVRQDAVVLDCHLRLAIGNHKVHQKAILSARLTVPGSTSSRLRNGSPTVALYHREFRWAHKALIFWLSEYITKPTAVPTLATRNKINNRRFTLWVHLFSRTQAFGLVL